MKETLHNIYWTIYIKTGEFDEIIFSLPFVIITAVIYCAIRKKRLKKRFTDYENIRKTIRANEVVRLLFFCWSVELVFLTLTPTEFWGGWWCSIASGMPWYSGNWRFSFDLPNFVPVFIRYAADGHLDWLAASLKHILPHLAVNILLFVPLGAALPILKKTSFAKVVLRGAVISLAIEIIQMFISRDSDIDDLLCNTLGAVIGYLLYLLVKRLFPRFIEKCERSASSEEVQRREFYL